MHFAGKLATGKDIEVVHIMLGANDANGGYNISQNDYKANLQTLITSLKNEGIKKIIVSNTPYNDGHSSLSLLSDYRNVVDELIDNKSILRGDILAYDWFYINWSGVHSDNVHLNQTGYAKLGEFRAAAIKSAIEYQINPDHYFTGGSTHTLETSGSLTFRVDKYFGEFSDVVKVDASPLAPSAYEATSGSTTIELTADYLNTLSAGSHTLSVGFEGGVWVEEDFTILPDPTPVPPTPSQPSQPASPSYSGGGGGGGASLSKDSCPNGDFSASYYDKTCGTTADVAEEVAKKVNVLRPLIVRIFLTATEAQKTFVHNLITSCSQMNKKEIIKLACQELVEKWNF